MCCRLDVLYSRVRSIIYSFLNEFLNFVNYRIWVSPRIPLKRSNNQTDGDSATNFKKDLLRYLRSYNLELLSRWINKIENADFSEIKYVHFFYHNFDLT